MSRSEIQKARELIGLRNEYVHPKIRSIPTEVGRMRDSGSKVALPIELTGEEWKAVGIPKRPMFWSDESARLALCATAGFLRLVISEFAGFEPEDAQKTLHSRLEINDLAILSTFEEFVEELRDTTDVGVSFEFLGI